MGSIRGILERPTRSKLRPESCALDLVELLDPAPGFVPHRARDVDFQSHDCHKRKTLPQRHRVTEKINNYAAIIPRTHGARKEMQDSFFLCLCVSVVRR